MQSWCSATAEQLAPKKIVAAPTVTAPLPTMLQAPEKDGEGVYFFFHSWIDFPKENMCTSIVDQSLSLVSLRAANIRMQVVCSFFQQFT